ncbi:PPM-type phosphatase-like domain containing protein [Babesia gibsoni]|uniref:protein-serine/threonine phosphatase n=1 Tax=Babesia gibsoni TaxID=33632 RepID=A0AAD8USH1_BABGI|nr:PPM-type phosphatase-like domain containing protein [Babesia gibsoni]
MASVLCKALGVSDKALPQSAHTYLKQSNTVAIEYDDGYLLIDQYGEKGIRKSMEDESLICTSLRKVSPGIPDAYDFTICGLFDGHGGRQCAFFAKSQLVNEIALQLTQNLESEGGNCSEISETVFKKSINAACSRLDSRIANELVGCNDGCTALLLFIRRNRIFVVNLGDSSAYLCRKLNSCIHAIPLNEAHKAWSHKEKERIIRYGGTVEGGRVNGVLEVTRSFGDLNLKRFGVLCRGSFRKAKLDFSCDEFILMGCDGFWSVYDAHEACRKALSLLQQDEVRASSDPHRPFRQPRQVCKDLVEHALTVKKAQDNVSVILLRLVRK